MEHLPPIETVWREIRGCERYWVSADGRVWSTVTSKLLKLVDDGQGYPGVHVGGKRRRVHRLVAEAFFREFRQDLVVRHLNDDKSNNRLENLALGTQSENMLDKVRNGNDVNSKKTHCPRDHEYTPENTIIQSKGSRECRECHRAHMKRQREKA